MPHLPRASFLLLCCVGALAWTNLVWAQDAEPQAPTEAAPVAEELAPSGDDAAPHDVLTGEDETPPAPGEDVEAQPEPAVAGEDVEAQPEPAVTEEETPDGQRPDVAKLKRDSKEAQEARKAAMKALALDNPSQPADPSGSTSASAAAAPLPPITRDAVDVLPRLEHHGYFRTRLDMFYNLDLDTKGSSPIPPPLDSKERGADSQDDINPTDSETLAGANLRFRYAPTLHISEDLRIHASMDILDNLVMGSSPKGSRAGMDSTLLGFEGSEDPSLEAFGRQAVNVRAAYAEIQTLMGTLMAGRMPDHWGLGIFANDGGRYDSTRQALGKRGWSCLDCDDGDWVDRVYFFVREPFAQLFYLSFSWDFVNEGFASYSRADSFGQAFDLAQADDVTQFVLTIFDKPVIRREVDERQRAYNDQRELVVDWGLLFAYRSQDLAINSALSGDGGASSAQLFSRDAELYLIDAWVQAAKKFAPKIALEVGLELLGFVGSVEHFERDDAEGLDILHIGAAFESTLHFNDIYTGLNLGAAYSQDVQYSGAVSEQNLFRFDRNYQIDLIMFTELLNGINNAIYFNPFIGYDFPIEGPQTFDTLGARLNLVTALAIEQDATPSGDPWYGFEADLSVYYEETNRFRAELATGLLLPGSAWTRKPNRLYPMLPSAETYEDHRIITKDYEPGIAWTIQTNLWWMF
ncbi:MAG: TIGR04551 family protein [Myxococcota bacterium]|jgi:uncharacterized protein (TIGR04551 family)|nr:TIGR04551 family protein [Myxococcota bacterium]